MGGLQSTERSLSVTASKGLSALRAAPDLCCAVNQRLTSVVREIRTLRSVGAGGSAPGDPVRVKTERRSGYLGTAKRKRRQTDNPNLMPPRHIPTLPVSDLRALTGLDLATP